MTLIDFWFPKLRTPKTLSDKCLKSLVSEDSSKSDMINLSNHGWNVHRSTFIIFIDHCEINSVGKSLFLTGQIVRLLVNTLPVDEKYPVLNRDNLKIPIQMQLSQKHKTFCQFFTAFLKSSWNFELFDKKDDTHRFCTFGITDSENVVI